MDSDLAKNALRFLMTEDFSKFLTFRQNAGMSAKRTRLGMTHHINSDFIWLSISRLLAIHLSIIEKLVFYDSTLIFKKQ